MITKPCVDNDVDDSVAAADVDDDDPLLNFLVSVCDIDDCKDTNGEM